MMREPTEIEQRGANALLHEVMFASGQEPIPNPVNALTPLNRAKVYRQVRAVHLSIKEPTPAMIEAAHKLTPGARVDLIWKTMVDAMTQEHEVEGAPV